MSLLEFAWIYFNSIEFTIVEFAILKNCEITCWNDFAKEKYAASNDDDCGKESEHDRHNCVEKNKFNTNNDAFNECENEIIFLNLLEFIWIY